HHGTTENLVGIERNIARAGPRRHNAADRMMTATENAPGKVEAKVRSVDDFSQPVVRPRKGLSRLIGEVLNHGGPGYLQFAITNICNAKCDFCGFAVDRFDPKQRRSVTLQETKDVINIAVKNH